MRKFSLLSLIIFLLMNVSAKAQSGSGWEWASISGTSNALPGRKVNQIATDATGNVYATGFFHGSLTLGGITITSEMNGATEAQNVFIAKYDASGNVLWLKRYAGNAPATNQNVNAITLDNNGNVYIGGNGLSIYTSNSAYLVKYDTNGNILWKKEDFPLYEVNGVNIGPDGNPLVMESTAGAKNIYKIDKTNGNIVWTASCNGAGSNAGTYYKDFTDNAGNVYFTCFNTGSANVNILGDAYTTTGGSFDANTFIASVDNNGVKRWSQIIPIVQVQLGYTVDANGKSYIQLGGGFGSTFQGVSTASSGGNRYLELDNTGTLTRYLPLSPYKGIFRVKPDGIYGYENAGGTTQAYTEVFGDYFFSLAAGATTKNLGIIIKYNPTDNDKVVWANSIETNGTSAYVAGGISTFETSASGKVIAGGNFVSSIKAGANTYTATANGSNPYDLFLAQFDGANVTLPPVTNWTGAAANGNWTDAGNWDNGVPNGNEKSIIPSGLTFYPSNVPTTAITGRLQIDAGANAALPVQFYAKGGLTNNGNATVIGTGFFQGFNTGSTPLSGSGRLIFTASSPNTIFTDITQSLEINFPSGTVSSYGGVLGGSLYLTNGKLSIALGSLNMTDPNASLTYSATSYISGGTLKRSINSNGDYTFPMGGSGQFNPLTLHLTNVVGPQNLSVSFSTSINGTTPNLNFGASTISTLLNTGFWTITPSTTITSGKYTLDLEAAKYTNGVTDPTRYLIIKRNNSTASWSLNGKKLSSTQTGGTISGSTLSNGLLDLSSENLTEFNDFAIGVGSAAIPNGTENGNTNWTGNAGNSLWTDAANWDNGVPTSGTNAIITAGKTTYPNNITATNTAAKLQIDATVNIKIPYNFIANAGIVNNGTLELTGTSSFLGFGNSTNGYSPLSGSGTLLFTSTGPSGINTSGLANIINNSVEIKGAPYFNMNSNVYLGGDVTLSNGTTLQGFTMYNPNAVLSVDATSYATSGITRYVNPTGTYNFPFTNGNVIVKSNGLNANQYINVFQNIGQGGSAPNFVYNSETINKYLNGAYFTVTPNTITTGNYDLTIEEKNATNTILDASKYLLINRTGLNNPWKFDGTAGTSSQGAGVSSASVAGLTATGQYGIGIIGQIVSNWTGAATNGVWADAANWDNGIPNKSIKAAFLPGLSSYPQTFPVAPATEAVSVASGANVKLAYDMTAPLGVVNDGTIEPIGVGTFSGFGSTTTISNISGSGTILFSASSPATFSGLINNNVEINRSGNLISNHGSVYGNINIVNGFVIPPLSNEITLTNPNASITLASSANAFQNKLVRNVNASGSYFFPVGDNALEYNPITITTNGITGTTSYGVFYSRITNPDNPQIFADGVPVLGLLNCDWAVYPNAAATAGALNINFEGRNYNGGGVDVSRYVLIRKVQGGPLGYEALSNCTFTENAGVINANITGVTPPAYITDYYIGVKGLTTTWTGAANDQNWATAANWDSGAPNSSYFAKFIAGSPNYPTSVSSSNTAAALSIASGVSFKLSEDFSSPNGIINNGTIEVTGSSFFAGFHGNPPLSGTGKLLFGTNGPAGIASSTTINQDMEITKGGTFTMSNVTLGGSLFMTNGIVSGSVIMTNPSATITYSPTAYISGTLKRTVNSSGNYAFPVGASNRFAPAILQLKNIVGPQNIIASFSTTINGSVPNTSAGGRTITSLLNNGIWTITPNTALTGGNYSVTLEGRGYTNGVTDAQAADYVVVKRANSSSAWAFYGDNGTSSQSGSVATATAGNIAGFSDFAIGIANGDVPTTLPVKLVNFLAKADGKSALLTWQTATEINNDRFEIERSLDGNSWVKIGEVKGAGNNYQLKNYSFRDALPANENNYYRLKQVDNDDAFEYSPVRSVKFNLGNDGQLSFYPNPVTDEIHFTGFSNTQKSIYIFDLNGSLVFSKSIIGESLKIPSTLQNGVYVLKINCGEESITKNLTLNK
ncbi:T9SS type A sorting domain-containing protein [Pedobacter sp. SD-b]|uniref:T9SS type A sorting domain-containing protein n=1 Tax=Pedobacter segetis TaxID=2793069 RepID=A0ABS1BNB1_9SPHI|nr:T9SS type A sorting domain-containing protein [Pedobacter segetis]MBK0384252.1 T9SS type A sorting domain-containing protein [Pedobacter segetis]